MSFPMGTWHKKGHSNDNYLVNMDNLSEEEKKHLIVALLLIINMMQLNILQEQRMMMTVMASNLISFENTIWCISF